MTNVLEMNKKRTAQLWATLSILDKIQISTLWEPVSMDFLKDMERLANLNGGNIADPLGRDFRKKYQRKFTEKESPELPPIEDLRDV